MEKNNEYSIADLIERLKNDESWESDPAEREMIANFMPIFFN